MIALIAAGLLNIPPCAPYNEQAVTNASAHVGWALAMPLAGSYAGGRKGLWIAGGSWLAYSAVDVYVGHPIGRHHDMAERRTDLLTRLLPTLAVLAVDLLRR